jgi:signal transduction histidine kinase
MAPELERLHAVDVRVSCDGSPHCLAVASLPACRLIADNLIGNAVQAGARQVYIVVAERAYGLDLIFRDNGRGMTEDQVRELGFGYSSKGANGHGQGFRIVRKLAADIGGVVAMPKSIPGLGTEVVVTLMKVGHALRAVTP